MQNKKRYRVLVDMVENGYIDVQAVNMDEAKEIALKEIDNGGFVGSNSYGRIVGCTKQ